AELMRLVGDLGDLPGRFADAGYDLCLVGGPVRDLMLGRSVNDFDLTTDARPDDIARILKPWATAVWDVGREFGTIGGRRGDVTVEITTFRSEHYDPDSRKPQVDFGDTLEGDLRRRDFTVNAMAIRLSTLEFIDPFDGQRDLDEQMLRTPGPAVDSFTDDPLRMMRAARFCSQLGFLVAPDVRQAMIDLVDRIDIVSAERVRDELSKLLLSPDPRWGLELLVVTGLAQRVMPEVPALALEIDEHHRHKDVYEHSLTVLEQAIELERVHAPTCEPDLVLRLAALLHDIGKPRTRKFEAGGGVSFHHHEVVGARMARKRMQALRFSNDEIDAVCLLIELHLRFHGYGSGEWTDSAVRRYVRDAGEQLVRLHKLTRADCTTRNQRKAAALRATYDHLEARIAVLSEQEELDAIRPDLNGQQIMEILGLAPGPMVGKAYKFLLDLRLDQGPLDADAAREALLTWWEQQSP
ncbi:MAG: CCA tRNA nucleotidyltransferase, partial [Actinomycetales bacterium]|nr:CCA tRNA nucleotidyltransferase [Actinomycetales bacterium]